MTYSAVINDRAKIGSEGNKNNVRYYYASNPTGGNTYDTLDKEPQESENIRKKKDQEIVYTYEIKFRKTDDSDTSKGLSGAVYGLYADHDCTKLVDRIETNKYGDGASSKVGVGTYYLKELVPPKGYSLDKTTVTPVEARWTTATATTTVSTERSEYTSKKPEENAVQVGWLKDNVFYAMDLYSAETDTVKPAYLSSNTKTADTVTFTEKNTAGSGVVVAADLKDTKLGLLPSTGGPVRFGASRRLSGDGGVERRMRKQGRKKRVGRVILFLTGLSILLYPAVSGRWNAWRADRLRSGYQETVRNTDTSETDEMRKAAEAYNRTLYVPSVPDAFSIRDGVKDKTYESLLNPNGDGVMGYLEIPAIDVSLPIGHYTTKETLEKGAGHLFGSSLPVGGKGTHSVISAHRGLPSAKLFTDLNLLKKGDHFFLHVLDETLAYEVDQILTVEPDQTESLAIDRSKDYVTLATCTPYAVNTQRLLVRGHRVPYTDEVYRSEEAQPVRQDKTRLLIQLLCAAAGVAIAAVIVRIVTLIENRRGGGPKHGG